MQFLLLSIGRVPFMSEIRVDLTPGELMTFQEFLRNAALMLGLGCAAGIALAAGGHHGVDDAAILEPGTCEVESWFTRAGAGERLLHTGAGCRVGPVELGVAAERARDPSGNSNGYGLQLKWAAEVAPGLSAGVTVSSGWQAHVRPRYQGTTVSTLLTWAVRDDLALHANVGRDLVHRASDSNRSGLAVEWMPMDGWSLTAERYAESATQFVRAGVRWNVGENFTLDLSRAHSLRGPVPSNWTLGATWLLDRR